MLYYTEKDIANEPSIYIWKTDETPLEILSMFDKERAVEVEKGMNEFRHDKRRMEFVTSRHIIYNIAGLKNIHYEPNGRPFVADNEKEISISHTKNYVAVSICDEKRNAIDIEAIGHRVERVAHKFLCDNEMSFLSDDENERILQLTVMWCVKETLYKLVPEDAYDFANVFSVYPFSINSIKHEDYVRCHMTFQYRNCDFLLKYKIFDDFVMVWTWDGITNI